MNSPISNTTTSIELYSNKMKENLNNIGFNCLWIIICIIFIIFIDTSISNWIFGLILFGNCIMLFVNTYTFMMNRYKKINLDLEEIAKKLEKKLEKREILNSPQSSTIEPNSSNINKEKYNNNLNYII